MTPSEFERYKELTQEACRAWWEGAKYLIDMFEDAFGPTMHLNSNYGTSLQIKVGELGRKATREVIFPLLEVFMREHPVTIFELNFYEEEADGTGALKNVTAKVASNFPYRQSYEMNLIVPVPAHLKHHFITSWEPPNRARVANTIQNMHIRDEGDMGQFPFSRRPNSATERLLRGR